MVYQSSVSDAGERRSEVVEGVISDVSRHGWAVIGVFPAAGDSGVDFSYTVGLSGQGLPELVTYGLPARTAGAVLNRVARTMVDSRVISPGDWFDSEGKTARVECRAQDDLVVALEMRDTSDLDMVRAIYGEVKSAMQIVWPVRDGLMPWELGGRAVEQQPLRGVPVKTPPLFRARQLGDVYTFAELAQALTAAESKSPEDVALSASNDRRVSWAGAAFLEYARNTGIYEQPSEDLARHLSDLLGDLRHLADALGADWEELAASAGKHYRAEIHGFI